MKKITLLLFLIELCSCYNKSKPPIEGAYVFKDSNYRATLTFESDSSLIHDFINDSEIISTNCDYRIKHDSIFIFSSQSQDHVSYLSIENTFLMKDKNVIIQASTGNVYGKIGGFKPLVNKR